MYIEMSLKRQLRSTQRPSRDGKGRNYAGPRGVKKAKSIQLPTEMWKEVQAPEEGDKRLFGDVWNRNFKNHAASRKNLRKQKRLEKKGRKASILSRLSLSSHSTPQKNGLSGGKNDIKDITPSVESTVSPDAHSAKRRKTEESSQSLTTISNDISSLNKLSKSNPRFFSLLVEQNLVNSSEMDITDRAFEEDDKQIQLWERKLGLNKKNKRLRKAFEEEGLKELLEGLDEMDGNSGKQRHSKTSEQNRKDEEEEEENEEENEEEEEDDDDDDDDEEDEEKDESEEDSETEDNEDEELEDLENKNGLDEIFTDLGESMDEEKELENEDGNNEGFDDKNQRFGMTITNKDTMKESKSKATKYVPPHLRAASGMNEQQIKLRRTLQGLFNRVSESNMENILVEIEACYRKYSRHDVTSSVTDLILTSISTKSHLLDSFVISYAVVVSGLYRLVGTDFAAHFIQALVESFLRHYLTTTLSSDQLILVDSESTPGTREARNLLTLVAELYNFQVVACVIVYDLVRKLISRLDEFSVELLLHIVKASGAQLRVDDPTALKDIILLIQAETNKRDPKTISSRHKFMLEQLANLKNNKVRVGQSAAGIGEKDLILKMKKLLSGISKKRGSVGGSEPIRVSLEDIKNVRTKGKWWLVGSSWKDKLIDEVPKRAPTTVLTNPKAIDITTSEALLQLARQQGMNTDVRRNVFIVLMSSEDYVDAFERLLKLNLTEVQGREIVRVLLHCCGNEKNHNPYYALIATKLCVHSYSYKVTFQYALWDFLREMGESEVGGFEKVKSLNHLSPSLGKATPLRKIVNISKCYAWLVSEGVLSPLILKTVNLTMLQPLTRTFFQLLFANIILNSQVNLPHEKHDSQRLTDIFIKVCQVPTLAKGVLFFVHHFIANGDYMVGEVSERELVAWGCRVIKNALQQGLRVEV